MHPHTCANGWLPTAQELVEAIADLGWDDYGPIGNAVRDTNRMRRRWAGMGVG